MRDQAQQPRPTDGGVEGEEVTPYATLKRAVERLEREPAVSRLGELRDAVANAALAFVRAKRKRVRK